MLNRNISWTTGQSNTLEQADVISVWKGPNDNIYLTLSLFILMRVRIEHDNLNC